MSVSEIKKRITVTVANPPACYRSLSGPSGPKCSRGVPWGVSGALRAPGSGVSKKYPESVPAVKRCPDTPDTLGPLLGPQRPGPEGPRDTPRDTGTLRAEGLRDSVAARGRKVTGFNDFELISRLPIPALCISGPGAAENPGNSLKTLTSLNKEVRPFFLSDNSTWSHSSVSSLSDYSIWRF